MLLDSIKKEGVIKERNEFEEERKAGDYEMQLLSGDSSKVVGQYPK